MALESMKLVIIILHQGIEESRGIIIIRLYFSLSRNHVHTLLLFNIKQYFSNILLPISYL